jgi:hypothetical protein
MSVFVDPARFLSMVRTAAMVRAAALAVEPENRHKPGMDNERIALLEKAAEALGGQRALARVLNVGERSVRAWLAGDRNISDGVLSDTQDALSVHAMKCTTLAHEFRKAQAPY